MSTIYKTEVFNEKGTDGFIETADGLRLKTTSTNVKSSEGADPEQFMGMAWSTCLNATMISLLEARKASENTRVRVEVEFKQDKPGSYYFEMTAYAAVEGWSEEESLKLANQAHKRCPVSKLIEKNEFVYVKAEAY